MAFDEIRLPTDIERGATGGPGFLTNVVMLNSGKEQRNSLWSVDRGQWDIGYGIQTREDALIVRDFFMARLGRARGFRFRDWSNYQALTEQPCDTQGDGATVDFQMRYRYQDGGGWYYEKTIYKPVAGTVTVYEDGVATTAFTLDSTTGIITMDSAPAYGVDVTWKGDFDLPVRFDTDRLDAVITTRQVISFPSLSIVELKL